MAGSYRRCQQPLDAIHGLEFFLSSSVTVSFSGRTSLHGVGRFRFSRFTFRTYNIIYFTDTVRILCQYISQQIHPIKKTVDEKYKTLHVLAPECHPRGVF